MKAEQKGQTSSPRPLPAKNYLAIKITILIAALIAAIFLIVSLPQPLIHSEKYTSALFSDNLLLSTTPVQIRISRFPSLLTKDSLKGSYQAAFIMGEKDAYEIIASTPTQDGYALLSLNTTSGELIQGILFTDSQTLILESQKDSRILICTNEEKDLDTYSQLLAKYRSSKQSVELFTIETNQE